MRREPKIEDDIIRLGNQLAEAVHYYLEACDVGADDATLDTLRERMSVARRKFTGEDWK